MNYKIFTSPVKRWPGTIQAPEYLGFPALVQWEKVAKIVGDDSNDLTIMADHVIPFLCKFVVQWDIAGLPEHVTPDEFPGSPDLLSWIIQCVSEVFMETSGIDPNLPEESSDTSDTETPPQDS